MTRQELIDLQGLMIDLAEYFDGIQDADCNQDGYSPNVEMKLYLNVNTSLNLIQREIQKDSGK